MTQHLVPWEDKAKRSRLGQAAPWHRVVPYLTVCGFVTAEDMHSLMQRADGQRVMSLAAARLWEALVTMGLSTAPADTPREYLLRVLSFLAAHVGVLGAQSKVEDDLFEEWEQHGGDTADPCFLMDQLAIGGLAVEMADGRFHLLHYATLQMLVGPAYRAQDRQAGLQYHMSSVALLDTVASHDSAVKALVPLIDRALVEVQDAVDELEGTTRRSTGYPAIVAKVQRKVEAVRRYNTPAMVLVAAWWKRHAPEGMLFEMDSSWPQVMSEISVRSRLCAGTPQYVLEVIRSRLSSVLLHHKSLADMLRDAGTSQAWSMMTECMQHLGLHGDDPIAAVNELDTLVSELLKRWEQGDTPKDRVSLFLKSAKLQRGVVSGVGHLKLTDAKMVDQEDDIFGSQSHEALAASLDTGPHTRYSKIVQKVEDMCKEGDVMPQQKLQVILTGSSTVHNGPDGGVMMVKGEPDVACQLLILSKKTKTSMRTTFVTMCIALRMHMLSYLGYYLAMNEQGQVLADMMAFTILRSSCDLLVAGKLDKLPYLFEMERMLRMAAGDEIPTEGILEAEWLTEVGHFDDYAAQVPRWLAAIGMAGEKASHTFRTFMKRILRLLKAIPRTAVSELQEMMALCKELVLKALAQVGEMIKLRLQGPVDQGPVQEELPEACTAAYELMRVETAYERGVDLKQSLSQVRKLQASAEDREYGTPMKARNNKRARTHLDEDASLQSLRDRFLTKLEKVDPGKAREMRAGLKRHKQDAHTEHDNAPSKWYKGEPKHNGKGKGKGRGRGKGGGKGKGGGDTDDRPSITPGGKAGLIVVDAIAKTWTYPGGHTVKYEVDGKHVDDHTGKCGKVALANVGFPQALEFCDKCEQDGHSRWSRDKHKFSREDRQRWQQLFAGA